MSVKLTMELKAKDHEDAIHMVDAIQAFLRTTFNRGLVSYGFDPRKGPSVPMYDDNDGDH